MEGVTQQNSFFPYLIFLPRRFFDTKKWYHRFFQTVKGNIVKELSYIGVVAKHVKDLQTMPSMMFDNELEPKLNMMYIHLFNGEYFSEKLYGKKKLQKERELLFLLAAKLGVSSIEYETDITETTLEKVDASINIKKIDTATTYSKLMSKSKGQMGKEIYLNRGAPVYCLSKNINQVEENIRVKFQKLNKKMFSYDFYQKNDSLKCFVYKRFSFKMLSLEYTSESEDIIDKSFEIKALLCDYGLGFKLNKNVSTTEKIVYKLQFFTDKELRLKLSETIRIRNDPFAIVREVYDAEEDKNIAVYNISEYVRKYAKQLRLQYIKHIGENDTDANNDKNSENGDSDVNSIASNASHKLVTNNYGHRLTQWISTQEPGAFETICKTFISTYQIKIWLYSTLKHAEDLDPVDTDSDNWGLIQLRDKNFNKYKNSNKKCDKLKDCNDEMCSEDTNHVQNSSNKTTIIKKSSYKRNISSQEYEDDSDDDLIQQRVGPIKSNNDKDDDMDKDTEDEHEDIEDKYKDKDDEFEDDGSDWEDNY